MKLSTAVRTGLAFGVAAVLGGVATAAVNSPTGVEPNPVFSTARINILQDGSARIDHPETLGLGQPVLDLLDGAPIYRAIESAGVTAYVANLSDGSLCIVAASRLDGTAMTCGTVGMAAAGQVTLRTQNRPHDPSLFVGIAPNDATGIQVDGQPGTVGNNAFIAIGSPTTGTYTLTGTGGKQVTVDMAIDQIPIESSGSN